MIRASQTDLSRDQLSSHVQSVPAFRALLRATEARLLSGLELPEPILDLGCGDGHFASLAFQKPLSVGIDPWWNPLVKAKASGAYQTTIQSSGDYLPFAAGSFSTIVSNSVLEHIIDVQPVLCEAQRVLRPGGKLIFTVPSNLFTEWLGGAAALTRLGLRGVADSYRRLFNLVSRHAHTDPPEKWARRLATAGCSIVRWQYYFSKKALWALEIGHLQGLPSAVVHALTGHWILGPWAGNLRYTERWLRPYYDEQPGSSGAYLVFVATKQSDGPILAELPEPDLLPVSSQSQASINLVETIAVEHPAPTTSPLGERTEQFEPELKSQTIEADPGESLDRSATVSEPDARTTRSAFSIVSATLLAVVVLFAIIAQSLLARNPLEPWQGLRWYAYSAAALVALSLRRHALRFPRQLGSRQLRANISAAPRQRWFAVIGLFVSLAAQRVASNATGARGTALALLLWGLAIVTTVYALHKPSEQPRIYIRSWRPGSAAAVLLFVSALGLRVVGLSEHPFVLNGIEASIGLDALAVIRGATSDPFSTAWLTNPTFPLFFLAIPLRLFGPSVVGIRLMSPLIGSLTVVATWLVGSRLWGRTVGLVSALLLAGSHLHLHYSRLGMTNVWDSLLLVGALGALTAAWERPRHSNGRASWLLAGGLAGLNAYSFTSSRILPLILVGVAFYVLFLHRSRLQYWWKDILAASVLALVVALPQILYYQSNPTVFMERTSAQGILESQSGWLLQEAARTGQREASLFGQQLLRNLLAFNHTLDKSPAYRPGVPLLGVGTGFLFVIGSAVAMLRLRQFKYALLIIWTGVTVLFAGALLIESPSSHRLVGLAPGLCILAAIAMKELGCKIVDIFASERHAHDNNLRRIVMVSLIAVAALISMNDVLFYFGRYQNQHSFGDRNTEIAHRLADYLNSLEGEWTVYFYGPPSMYVDFPTIPFLTEGFVSGINLFDVVSTDTSLQPATTQRIVHVYLPERSEELDIVRNDDPLGTLRTEVGYHANPLFYAYETHVPGT